MDWKPYLIGGGIIMAIMGGVTLVCVILAYRLYGWWNKAKADLQAEKDVSAARKEMADEAHQEHTKTIQRLHAVEQELAALKAGIHAADSRDTVPVEAEASAPPVASETANGKRTTRSSRKRAAE